MRILVGDPEQEYGEVIEELMRYRSHRTVLAANRESFLGFLERASVDLIVMSSSLSEGPPEDLVAQIRRTRTVPIVMTFEAGSALDLAACFYAGADDCVRKPFHPGEFAARIEAIARRFGYSDGSAPSTQERIEGMVLPASSCGLWFDPQTHRVFLDGVQIRCSRLEYEILSAMAETDGAVLPYSYLNQRVWGYSGLSDATMLKGHISSIRAKLREAGMSPDLIRTVNGVGYALTMHNGDADEQAARAS